MLNSVNKVIILGVISSEPSVKYTENGFFIATMSVMTKSLRKSKIEEKTEYKNEWHRILLYGKFESMIPFLKKEKHIYLEGSLRTNKWQDKDGNSRYLTEIVASEIKPLDFKINDLEINMEEEINKNNKIIFDENVPF